MTLADVDTLPTTLDVQQVADAWGCSPWAVYGMAKAGTCPVAPLHLGRKLRWPTAPVLRSIGLDPGREEGASAETPPVAATQTPSPSRERDHGLCLPAP